MKAMFSFSQATREDLPALLTLLSSVRKSLEEEGNFMWSGGYPDQSDLARDIFAKSLYVVREKGKLIAACALSYDPLEAFFPCSRSPEKLQALLQRSAVEEKARVVILHRLMVLPEEQHRGAARFLLEKLEAQEKGAIWLFAVYPRNAKALLFYPHLGFENLGLQLFEYGEFSSQVLFRGRFN